MNIKVDYAYQLPPSQQTWVSKILKCHPFWTQSLLPEFKHYTAFIIIILGLQLYHLRALVHPVVLLVGFDITTLSTGETTQLNVLM